MIEIIDTVFWIFMLMLFAKILSSWIPEIRDHPALQFIARFTDPYLNVFKGLIPPLGMIDISPIVAFIALGFIEHILKWLVLSI